MPRTCIAVLLTLALLVPASAALGAVRIGTPRARPPAREGLKAQQMHGTPLKDPLLGGSGRQALRRGGDEVLWGNRLPTGPSRGIDRIFGGDGNDRVYGSRGSNVIDGGPAAT